MIASQAEPAFRIVTIGEESVGKTSITNRLISDSFNPYESGTIGANYHQYTEEIEGHNVDVQIWDTAGQERFKSLSPLYFRGADAAVAAFSVTSKGSFTRLNNWIESFTEIAGTKRIIYIAANKIDLEDEIEVNQDEASEWAQTCHFKIYFTSAKTGIGIKELFHDLASDLYHEKLKKNLPEKHDLLKITSEGGSCC